MNKNPKDCSCFEKGWRFENPIHFCKRMAKNVKYSYQRIRYGYCDRDIWSIRDWFLAVIPNMLDDMADNLHGFPSSYSPDCIDVHSIQMEDSSRNSLEEWKDTLKHMAFLLREAGEETCTRKNLYESEWLAAHDAFADKYGFLGEGLKSPEEIEKEKGTSSIRIHFPSELPEYKKLSDRYFKEERKLQEYRELCKKEGLEIFEKWFWDLWD